MTYGVVNADLMTTSDGVSSAGLYGLKNRLINGDMRIDQRNAGASVTPANNQYLVDRWFAVLSQSSKFSVQQNAGSVTPPVGFTNYLGVTSLSAYTVGASEFFGVRQTVEGLNIADLAWGTANAATVTLSFWVRSSLTGTFGAGLINSNGSRAYPISYTINSANTWEQKSVTITGDTTGTWLTTNGIGVTLTFGLGYGSSLSGAAGAWNAGTAFMPTGATSVVGTSGATFYITGVQLEKGSTATSFDYRPYGAELALCQRYYSTLSDVYIRAYQAAGQALANTLTLPVTMRAVPTLTKVGTWTVQNTGQPTVSSANGSSSFYISFSATAGADTYVLTPSTSTYITAAAEL